MRRRSRELNIFQHVVAGPLRVGAGRVHPDLDHHLPPDRRRVAVGARGADPAGRGSVPGTEGLPRVSRVRGAGCVPCGSRPFADPGVGRRRSRDSADRSRAYRLPGMPADSRSRAVSRPRPGVADGDLPIAASGLGDRARHHEQHGAAGGRTEGARPCLQQELSPLDRRRLSIPLLKSRESRQYPMWKPIVLAQIIVVCCQRYVSMTTACKPTGGR